MKLILSAALIALSAVTGCAADTDVETEADPTVGVTQQPVTGVEPDEIDVAVDATASGETAAPKPARKVTYGPIITIKPKG